MYWISIYALYNPQTLIKFWYVYKGDGKWVIFVDINRFNEKNENLGRCVFKCPIPKTSLDWPTRNQGCISCGTCSYLELTEDHVLTSAYVKIFRIVTRNAVNKSFWRKKDCSWPPLNKYAMNIWLSSLRIRAHLSWRTGKHLHVLHVLRTYSTCSCPGQQDTTTYAALPNNTFGKVQKGGRGERAFSIQKFMLQHYFPKMWGGVKGRLELFRKFIRFGVANALIIRNL